MNNLKTAQRNRLGSNLNNLMMWYTAGKDLACSQVPVMDILAEFRALAGIKGAPERPPRPRSAAVRPSR